MEQLRDGDAIKKKGAGGTINGSRVSVCLRQAAGFVLDAGIPAGRKKKKPLADPLGTAATSPNMAHPPCDPAAVDFVTDRTPAHPPLL